LKTAIALWSSFLESSFEESISSQIFRIDRTKFIINFLLTFFCIIFKLIFDIDEPTESLRSHYILESGLEVLSTE